MVAPPLDLYQLICSQFERPSMDLILVPTLNTDIAQAWSHGGIILGGVYYFFQGDKISI